MKALKDYVEKEKKDTKLKSIYKRFGVSNNTFKKWLEAEPKSFTLFQLEKISKIINVNVNQIIKEGV